MKFKFSVLVAILLSVGCATSAKDKSPTIGKSLAVSVSDSAAGLLLPITSIKRTAFVSLDGVKLTDGWSAAPTTLDIEPGIHTITISCNVIYGGLNVNGRSEHEINFVADKVYSFSAQFGNNQTCVVVYKEI